MDIDHLRQWVGRTEEVSDVATPAPLAGLAALLDHAEPPWSTRELPPLAHWLYFLARAPQSEIDADGHPRRGGFLPPVPLPRRMWAGSRIAFHASIAVGNAMTRRSTIVSVDAKTGSSGAMVFVTVRHEIASEQSPALVEEQDIVYREAPKADAGAAEAKAISDAPRQAEWTRRIEPDPVQLFRYSALTFNGHRIHYDRDYCREQEGYPGLVVHGPFTATLLADHFLRRAPRSRLASLQFRARRPLFDTASFKLCGTHTPDGADLWAEGPSGETAMTLSLALSA